MREINNANTRSSLEAAYNKLKAVILDLWTEAKRVLPERFGLLWNSTLDVMAKRRRRLYRRYLIEHTTETYDKYKEEDKRIKRAVKQIKENYRKHILEKLSGNKRARSYRHVRKIWGSANETEGEDATALNLSSFTEHMSTPTKEAWAPTIRELDVNDWHTELIEKAIKVAPQNKATGADEIFVEALRIEPKAMSTIPGALWRKCGVLKHIPNKWTEAVLVPLFKNGDKTSPEAYRPIVLLSHMRRVIDSATAMAIRREYKFRDCQLGFQHGTGTETAIVRHISNAEHMRVAAVLDLNSAYDSVSRDKLHGTLKSKLTDNTAGMTDLALQPVTIRTQGDATNRRGTIAKGVCQGSSLSPMLFNIYMDNYVENVSEKMTTSAENRVTKRD